jgi:hypothetical protein
MSAANGTNNQGHGHVYERPDGSRARCGGPRICGECAFDAARLLGEQTKKVEGLVEAHTRIADLEREVAEQRIRTEHWYRVAGNIEAERDSLRSQLADSQALWKSQTEHLQHWILRAEGFRSQLAQAREKVAELQPAADCWNAIAKCYRITCMGTAGVFNPHENGYAHATFNFWTIKGDPPKDATGDAQDLQGRSILGDFMMVALKNAGTDPLSTPPAASATVIAEDAAEVPNHDQRKRTRARKVCLPIADGAAEDEARGMKS